MTRLTSNDSPTLLFSLCFKAYLDACTEWIVASTDSSQSTTSLLIFRLPSRMSTYLMTTSRRRRSSLKVEGVQSAQTKLIWCLRWRLRTKMNKCFYPNRERTPNWRSFRTVHPKVPSSILHSAKCISRIGTNFCRALNQLMSVLSQSIATRIVIYPADILGSLR